MVKEELQTRKKSNPIRRRAAAALPNSICNSESRARAGSMFCFRIFSGPKDIFFFELLLFDHGDASERREKENFSDTQSRRVEKKIKGT